MQFCKECDNSLFAVEENNKLYLKCVDCGFKELYNGCFIEKKNYKNKDVIQSDNNKYLIHDPSIPRTCQKICPNQECISIKNPDMQEAIFITDSITLKITYICVNCNTEWKYS